MPETNTQRFTWAQAAGILVMILGMGVIITTTVQYLSFRQATPAQKLQAMWAHDLIRLQSAGKLPTAWPKIKTIEVFAGTERAKEWLENLNVPITPNPEGTHHLEVLLLSWSEAGKFGAIVQYNLVDLASENMVWELGRTFQFEKDQFFPCPTCGNFKARDDE